MIKLNITATMLLDGKEEFKIGNEIVFSDNLEKEDKILQMAHLFSSIIRSTALLELSSENKKFIDGTENLTLDSFKYSDEVQAIYKSIIDKL